MDRAGELERLVFEQQDLFEQIKRSPTDLDLRLQFADILQKIRAIDDGFSNTALFFARPH